MAQTVKRHEGLAAHDLFAFPQFGDDLAQMGDVLHTQAKDRVRLPSERREEIRVQRAARERHQREQRRQSESLEASTSEPATLPNHDIAA